MTCEMTCFCAVSLSGTMQPAMSVPLGKIPWAAIFSMAKSSCAERTILVVRILVNTWDFETHVAVLHGFGVKIKTLNLRNLKIESSSCQCSMASIGQREEIQKDVFKNFTQKKSRPTPRNSREDTGHSSVLETKRSGMELSFAHLKEKWIPSPHRWWNEFKEPVIQYSRASVLCESWNSDKKE